MLLKLETASSTKSCSHSTRWLLQSKLMLTHSIDHHFLLLLQDLLFSLQPLLQSVINFKHLGIILCNMVQVLRADPLDPEESAILVSRKHLLETS